MAQVRIAAASLFGPAGSVSTDKRVRIAQGHLFGETDKRVRIAQANLTAPPPDSRVWIAQAHLQGPEDAPRSVYYGTSDGWVPVDLYLADGTVWKKVT